MRPADNYRLCFQCDPPHIENCGSCFGFGIKRVDKIDGPIPIRAADASTVVGLPCPECGSTTKGVTAFPNGVNKIVTCSN